MAQTGGQSVLVSDAFGREGLTVPDLTQESYDILEPIVTVVGGSYKNPLDVSGSLTSIERGREMLDTLAADTNTDIVVIEASIGFISRRLERQGKTMDDLIDMFKEFQESTDKPFGVIATWNQDEAALAEFRIKIADRGIAVFPSFQDAARAIRRLREYYVTQAELAAGS